jgi:Fe-S cluster assembly protein SufD
MSTLADKIEFSSVVIDACSRQMPDDFQQVRNEALQSLSGLKLPGQKAEEYRFTPIVRTLEKLFPAWPERQALPSAINDIRQYLVDGVEAYVVVLVNGRYNEGLSDTKGAPMSIGALTSHDSSDVLFKLADPTKDAFVAWNTTAWTGGAQITVGDNQNISRPVLLLNIIDAATPVVEHARVAVRIGKHSRLSLISRNVSVGDNPSFSTLVEELLVAENATLNYCRIQDDSKEFSFTQTSIRQLTESHVNTFTLTLDGKLIRNNLSIAIDGERSESHFHGLYLLNGETIADNHTVVDHRKPNSVSNELYKGVMDGKSKAIFNGKIFVRPDAQKTNAFQSNRNILLSEQSTINTKPQLEIWADDVKCSHGCTTGQLDEEALFYLRSRGIPREQAIAMLLYAFAAETFSFIESDALKSYVNALVTKRLNKGI